MGLCGTGFDTRDQGKQTRPLNGYKKQPDNRALQPAPICACSDRPGRVADSRQQPGPGGLSWGKSFEANGFFTSHGKSACRSGCVGPSPCGHGDSPTRSRRCSGREGWPTGPTWISCCTLLLCAANHSGRAAARGALPAAPTPAAPASKPAASPACQRPWLNLWA
jgi:hypothetical protein